jgi:hypothetical protein
MTAIIENWELVKPLRALNGPAAIWSKPTAASAATMRLNAAAVALLGLKKGMRLVVYAPGKGSTKRALAIGTHIDGVALNGNGSYLQCGGSAFAQAMARLDAGAVSKRYRRIKFAIIPTIGHAGILAELKPVESELAP